MNVDYKKRTMLRGDSCTVIRYGETTEAANLEAGYVKWIDVPTGFEELSYGGKKPGQSEEERRSRNHYYNERFRLEEELRAVQASSNPLSVGTHNTRRSTERDAYVEAAKRSVGGDN